MPLLLKVLLKLRGETGVDLRADRGDAGAEDGQDTNHTTGNAHTDQGVRDETLALLTREKGADFRPPSPTLCTTNTNTKGPGLLRGPSAVYAVVE